MGTMPALIQPRNAVGKSMESCRHSSTRCSATGECGSGGARHGHVYLAVRMAMMRTRDIIHFDHIDAEAMGRPGRLHDAAVLDSAGFTATHPAGRDALIAGITERTKDRSLDWKRVIQVVLQSRIEAAPLDLPGNLRDQFGEVSLRHRALRLGAIRRRTLEHEELITQV